MADQAKKTTRKKAPLTLRGMTMRLNKLFDGTEVDIHMTESDVAAAYLCASERYDIYGFRRAAGDRMLKEFLSAFPDEKDGCVIAVSLDVRRKGEPYDAKRSGESPVCYWAIDLDAGCILDEYAAFRRYACEDQGVTYA